jgi:hypothetical protein
MANFLQVSLSANLDSDAEPEINVTPVDQKISDQVGDVLESVISLADLTDMNPRNGQFEVPSKLKIPVKQILGKSLGRFFSDAHAITLPVVVTMKIVEKK